MGKRLLVPGVPSSQAGGKGAQFPNLCTNVTGIGHRLVDIAAMKRKKNAS
jgi:hypothetical protein